MSVDLSICVVNYNSWDKLGLLLRSLESSAERVSHEILVVDNASTEQPDPEVAALVRRVDLVTNARNVFYTRAANQNFARAKGRFALSINPDCVALPGAVEAMVAALRSDVGLGAVAPRFIRDDGSVRPSAGRFPTRAFGVFQALGLNGLFPNNGVHRSIMVEPTAPGAAPEVLYGACLMVRREVFETVGTEDEKLVHGWDEYDWCRRMRSAGWRLAVVPTACVRHSGGVSRSRFQRSAVLDRLDSEGFRYLYAKHYGPVWDPVLRVLSVAAVLLGIGVRIARVARARTAIVSRQ